MMLDNLAATYLGDRDEIQTITRAELDAWLQRGNLALVAVRPETEYAAGHIPDAISIPPDQLDEALDTLPGVGDVATYCRGPSCAYADDAVRALLSRGRPVFRLEEGLPELRRNGGTIEHNLASKR